MDEKFVYQKAISVHGEVHQMRKAQEECGELVAAINQYLDFRIDDNALASEVADVEIMIEQMRIILGEEKINAAKAYKINRLIKMMNNG